ncbi:MAG: 3-methyl-2-oxobutanoate dehydrogenase subunit VorB [Spirochaetaceae bacterium]|jgi:2-oxoglutarate ferredoxin oxidoreductase subunit alpha|nr:3-methyl-2-oxobutanoate dehydrogenase subunit VorB [Spirochaetaceae bacterium]
MRGEQVLMKGNEAIAEAAIRAGCRAYFGYPITPQNEIIAYMARHLMDRGGVFIQAESEVAAINMVYGASCAGVRAMTSSSSPGVSLKQEGISYAAGADIPLVLVNVVRGGPGLGSISPAQSDYFQSTRGGGHGDYRCIVLAPQSVQECADLTALAFELSDRYRMPAILQADGIIGQMMEGVRLPDPVDPAAPAGSPGAVPSRDWAVGHRDNRPSRHITSIFLVPEELEARNRARFARYELVKERETRFEALGCEDADVIVVAYGTCARVALGARQLALEEGIRAGIFRPVTLWPFPGKALGRLAAGGRPVLTVEMSQGQLVEDVKLALFDAGRGAGPGLRLLGHSGGVVPTEEEVFAEIRRMLRKGAES